MEMRRIAGVAGATVIALGVATGTALAATAAPTTAAAAPTTWLLSHTAVGVAGAGQSMLPWVSRSGRYVTFRSTAGNLIPREAGDPPARDVYLWDRTTGTLEVVSVDSSGRRLPGHSGYDPSPVTSNGTYVAFSTLVGQNYHLDLRTRTGGGRGTTEDLTPAGNGSSFAEGISENGRYVSFSSFASNLVPGDTNGVEDVFLYDRVTRTTTRVGAGNGLSYTSSVDASGRYVAYMSWATDLVPGDTNGAADVFVYDRVRRTTQRVSVDGAGGQLVGDSHNPIISGDGRLVAFEHAGQVYVRDRVAGTTTAYGDLLSNRPSISGDGRYLSYDHGGQVYVRDLVRNRTFAASTGNPALAPNGQAVFSWAGDTGVAYQSLTRNNGFYQVFYRSF